jgi:hypothetical protein
VEFKGISTIMLAILHELISGVPYETSSKQFERPALIDPWESKEEGLFRLTTDFVASLRAIADSSLGQVAIGWAATEEMQLDNVTAADCEMVLRELIRLAKDARQTQRDMYYWWSL